MPIIFVLVIAVVIILGIGIFFYIMTAKRKNVSLGEPSENSPKNRDAVLKEVNRRLASDPKDTSALTTLAELYYKEGDYRKAARTYQLLFDQGGRIGDSVLDENTLSLHYGISAMHSGIWPEAYNALMVCRSRNPENFDVNLNLGKVEFHRKNFVRAVNFLKKANAINAASAEVHRFLGMCLYEMKRYKEATTHLKQAVKDHRSDTELLYVYARCEYEASRLDSAHTIFRQIINDPKWGGYSALYSGKAFGKKQNWPEAIEDFQTGLNHKNIPNELLIELQYCLAEAYSKSGFVDKALFFYNEVYTIAPGYKDIEFRISQHRELNSNKNFQLYIMSSTNEFIALVHKIVQSVFPNATVQVSNVNYQRSDYIELLAEVRDKKREDIVLFRFMRIEGPVGELLVRDFYGSLKELHAERGFFFAPGLFSIEANLFVEARLIELWDKEKLLKLLKTLDTRSIKNIKKVSASSQ